MHMHELFEKHNDEFLEFKRIPKTDRPSERPDLCAFLYLDKLFPGKRDMVCSAEHDEIWLDVESKHLKKLSENDVIYLTRCGVRWDSNNDSLAMFV